MQKLYYWDDGLDALIREAWVAKARRRYSDLLGDIRPTDEQPKPRPNFVPKCMWDVWLWEWEMPTYIEKKRKKF